MISYYDGQITDILPWHISDSPEVKALGYALNKGTKLLYKYAQRLYLWTNIDNQPENVLDLMAAELRTQYYNQNLSIESKRQLVKNTLIWYMTAGTPEAVEELITAIFGEGEVKEWFEYDGKPYCFKVVTSAIMTPEMGEFFLMMLQHVKNTRSHLEVLEIRRIIEQIIYVGILVFPNYKPAIITGGYDEKREVGQKLFTGIKQFLNYKPPVITNGYKEQREARQELFIGTRQFLNYKPAAIIEGYSTASRVNQELHTGVSERAEYKPPAVIDS